MLYLLTNMHQGQADVLPVVMVLTLQFLLLGVVRCICGCGDADFVGLNGFDVCDDGNTPANLIAAATASAAAAAAAVAVGAAILVVRKTRMLAD